MTLLLAIAAIVFGTLWLGLLHFLLTFPRDRELGRQCGERDDVAAPVASDGSERFALDPLGESVKAGMRQ